jgi:hypothetical protein
MANDEHVAMLKKGVDAWKAWRVENPDIRPDFSRAKLGGTNLREANLIEADLRGADLREANLIDANLRWANLTEADLRGAILLGANLRGADLREANLIEGNLRGANLGGADLREANLGGAHLGEADLTEAVLHHTVFGATDLTDAKGLNYCDHKGPSTIDFHTLKNSGPLPIAFLRGAGLPDNLIEYLPSLLNEAIQRYSCFISHSSKDKDFAERLHADLQNKGVRCWLAPHDMPIGIHTTYRGLMALPCPGARRRRYDGIIHLPLTGSERPHNAWGDRHEATEVYEHLETIVDRFEGVAARVSLLEPQS